MANKRPGYGLMRRGAILFVAVCVLAGISGCGRLAPIAPVSPGMRADTVSRCRAHYLMRPWQIVQSMTAYLPGGDVGNAISVTRIYPESGRVQCVIMGLEGIVLFDGVQDDDISVTRAVPPFDDPRFQQSLFADIRLAFLPPDARDVRAGTLTDGTPVCRYVRPGNEGFVEVRLSGKSRSEIRQYTAGKKLRKTVTACFAPACGNPEHGASREIPASINVFHHGFFDYRLELKLLRAKALNPEETAGGG